MAARSHRPFSLVVAVVLSACAASAEAFVWPNVPEKIAKGLASSDPTERRVAAQETARLPPALARPLVQKAMADEDPEVRIAAAAVAVKLKLEGAGDLVASWLTEPDSRVRLAACEVIRVSPTDRSIGALGRVLSDPSKDVRLAAARAMGRATSASASSLLLGHLDDASPEVRVEVAAALGRLGDARAVLPLVGKVQDTDHAVRRAVARALGELGDVRATSALVVSLNDAAVEVRVEAAHALGRIGGDDATLALAPLVQIAGDGARGAPSAESAHAVREAALTALGRIATPRAVELLIAALDGDRPDAERTPAQAALVAVGAPAVRPLLATLAHSVSPRTATGAVQALGAIGDASAAPAIVRGMQRGVVPVTAGLRGLARLRSPDALPAILELISGDASAVRVEAIRAAGELLDPTRPDGRAVDPVVEALRDPTLTLDERVGLVRLLGRAGSPRAGPTLLQFSSDKSAAVRRAALVAMGGLSAGSAAIDAALVSALDADGGAVRTDAAIALSKVGTPAAGPVLLERLLRSAEQDRAALGLALSGVLGRTPEGPIIAQAKAALGSAPSSARDALIEGLGRAGGAAALEALRAAAGGHVDDRRKIAEALAGHGASARPELVALASDADAGVRAAAVWSLGFVGADEPTKQQLTRALQDADAAVAGNAAASLGRAAAAAKRPEWAKAPLCAALHDPRAYVRANALAGLDLAGAACERALVESLLASDPADAVRVAAARHLHDLAREHPTDPAVRRGLRRCAAEEVVFRVAQVCERGGNVGEGRMFPLVVFVVPDGGDLPQPRAPFSLVRPDGTIRLGLADRRGVVFEAQVPEGMVELAVPAPLAWSRP